MKATEAGMRMDKYAAEQAAARLGRFAFELRKSAKSKDPDAIHDLRVSIRRFTQCLKVFRRFFPAKGAKKIRRQLRTIMDAAAEVRNRDIALDLCKEATMPRKSQLHQKLLEERKQAEKELAGTLKRMSKRELSKKWRSRLSL